MLIIDIFSNQVLELFFKLQSALDIPTPLGGRHFLSIFENVIDFNANDVKIHIFWNLRYKIVEKMWLTHQNSLKNGSNTKKLKKDQKIFANF